MNAGNLRILYISVLLGFFLPPKPVSAFNLAVTSGGILSDPIGMEEGGFDPQFGLGFAILPEFNIGYYFNFELGFAYFVRKYKRTLNDDVAGTNFTFEHTNPTAEVFALIRWRLGYVFSIGLGPYYARNFGGYKVVKSGNAGVLEIDEGSPSRAGLASNDYGLMGSIGLSIPYFAWLHIKVDLRYSRSFNDVNQGRVHGSWYYSDLQALIGAQLRISGDH